MQIIYSKEKSSEHEDIVITTIQNETHGEKHPENKGKSVSLGGNFQWASVHVTGVPEREAQRGKEKNIWKNSGQKCSKSDENYKFPDPRDSMNPMNKKHKDYYSKAHLSQTVQSQ